MTVSPTPVVLITGANRGIGLEFVRQLLSGKHAASAIVPHDAVIVATLRDPAASKDSDLYKWQQQHKARLDLVQFDTSNEKHIADVVKYVTSKYGRLDLLINNSATAEESFLVARPSNVDFKVASDIFIVNVVGPVALAGAFIPLLKSTVVLRRAELAKAGKEEEKDVPLARVVFISSIAGSVGETITNPYMAIPFAPSYRASKTALSMYARLFAIETPEILFQLLHPGVVATRAMDKAGEEFAKIAISTEESVTGQLNSIARATLTTGSKAIDSYDGKTFAF